MKHVDPLEPILQVYVGLMEELSVRFQAIFAIGQARDVLPDFLAYECCHLQFRKMCEIMALACLTVHSDVATINKRLRKAYQADLIMNALVKLNPDFNLTAMSACHDRIIACVKYTIANVGAIFERRLSASHRCHDPAVIRMP